MNDQELAAMAAVEDEHWWFCGKRRLVENLLRPGLRSFAAGSPEGTAAILDIGAGTGANARHFSGLGRVWALDRSATALEFCRRRGIEDRVEASAEALPFPDRSFDVVLALDILEHVDDDLRMLREIRRVLKPSGLVALHVPAWPKLWSSHDEALGHVRRYTRRGLFTQLEASGLILEQLTWSTFAPLPVAAALRLLRGRRGLLRGTQAGPKASKRSTESKPPQSDLGELPGPLNILARRWMYLEAAVAARTGLPAGLSLAALARRP